MAIGGPRVLDQVGLDQVGGWWMSTNHSKQTIGQSDPRHGLRLGLAHVAHGRDLVDSLGD